MPVRRECFSFISFLNWLDKGTWKFPLSLDVHTVPQYSPVPRAVVLC